MNILLQIATLGCPAPDLSYLALAQINWDHFGKDARTVYNIGHGAALDVAIKGKASNEQLERAYAMNAFADHFLEDCFAAGHLRTPRRVLHKQNDPTADICAKLMHDEDNAISLNVENLQNQKFKAYGDKRLLSPDNATNLAACKSAVTASAAEIYEAWHTGKSPVDFKAWHFAPMLESALDAAAQELKPLFIEKNGVQRRSDIRDRRDSSLTTHFWYWSTALDCKSSGRWKYPQPKMDS